MQILEHGIGTCFPATVSALGPSSAAHLAQLLPLLPARSAQVRPAVLHRHSVRVGNKWIGK
jgi:hypothetical protein